MTSHDETAPDRVVGGLQKLGAASGWFIAFGVINIVVGVIALFMPGATLVALAVLLGVELVISGVFRLIGAFATAGAAGITRVLWVVLGVLGIVLGIWALRNLFVTIAALGVLLGVWWVVEGIGQVVAGVEAAAGRAWFIASGVLSVLAGVLMLAWPRVSVLVVAVFAGIWLIVLGATQIGIGWDVQRAKRLLGA